MQTRWGRGGIPLSYIKRDGRQLGSGLQDCHAGMVPLARSLQGDRTTATAIADRGGPVAWGGTRHVTLYRNKARGIYQPSHPHSMREYIDTLATRGSQSSKRMSIAEHETFNKTETKHIFGHSGCRASEKSLRCQISRVIEGRKSLSSWKT